MNISACRKHAHSDNYEGSLKSAGSPDRDSVISRRKLSSSRWFCLIPIGFPIPVLPRCFRLRREKSVASRHLNFQESLGVEDVTLFDDFVLVEQKSSYSVDLVGSERSLCVPRQGAVDIVPHRRRERPIAPKGQYGSTCGD